MEAKTVYDYYKLDVTRFLRESYTWEKKIESIEKEKSRFRIPKESAGQLSLLPEDETAKDRRKKEMTELDAKQSKYRSLLRLKNHAFKKLSEKERDALNVYFGKYADDGSREQFSMLVPSADEPTSTEQEFEDKYDCCRGTVHLVKKDALKHLENILYYATGNSALGEYYRFDIKTFLQKSSRWEEDIASLERDIRELSLIGSPSLGGVYSGKTYNISRPVETAILLTEQIEEKISVLRENLRIRDEVMRSLTEREFAMIQITFLEPNSRYNKQVRRERVQSDLGMSEATAYRSLNRGKEKLQKAIEKRYPKEFEATSW